MLNLPSGWEIKDNHLQKTFEFKTFLKTMSFVNAVAWVANAQNHHPEMIVNFNKCVIRTTTHDANNTVSEKDYQLAEAIEKLG